MLCKMILRRYTIYSSLAFVLSVFISFLFLSSDSFAVSDLVINYDLGNVTGSQYIDVSSYTSSISDFSYLTISNTQINPVGNTAYVTLYSNSKAVCQIFPYYVSSSTCTFDSSKFSLSSLQFRIFGDGVATHYTFTFSENSPFGGSCPECEVCQVCPVIPDNPYDNKLDQLIRSVYVCAGTMLVLYFFYCIYRLIIKNSGVK